MNLYNEKLFSIILYKTMKTVTIVMCVVALILGMLMFHMLKGVCGCGVVVEGAQGTCSDDGTTCCLKTKEGKWVVDGKGMKKCGESGTGEICTCRGSRGWFGRKPGTCSIGKNINKDGGYVCVYDPVHKDDKLDIEDNNNVVVDEGIGL